MRPSLFGDDRLTQTSSRPRGILVGPVAVLVEEAAGGLFVVAEAVAAHADLREEREEECGQAGADDPHAAVERRALRLRDDQPEADQDQRGRQDVADYEQ